MSNHKNPATTLLRLVSVLGITLVGAALPAGQAVAAEAEIPSVVRDAADLPKPLAPGAARTHKITIETKEVVGRLGDGSSYEFWTFDGKVPGPFLRVREGDTVEMTIKNAADSKLVHSIDLHAVTGPGGGAVATQTPPGKSTKFTFKAINAGVYVYHCATHLIHQHMSNGMYGLIMVEPKGGMKKVDREFYVMQGELYTAEAWNSTKGQLTFDANKLAREQPEYIVFNGHGGVAPVTGSSLMMKAKVGETVRIYWGVGGPNLTSSFHVIGEIFDRVYNQASLTSAALTDVQTTTVAPGGATVVEFKLDVPGNYLLVDHALTRLYKGGLGILAVEGRANPAIFKADVTSGGGH